MKQTTLTLSSDDERVVSNTEIGNAYRFGEDKTTLTFSPNEEKVCPVCGKVCPNDVYCINCGHIWDQRLLRLQAAKVASLEDED